MKSFLFFFVFIYISVIESTIPSNKSYIESHTKSNETKVIYKYLISKKSCFFRGVNYLSGERIVRRNPCHICVCVKGSVQCFWQSCPPPPEGCSVIQHQGICNPSLYNCPIPERNASIFQKSRRIGKSESGLVRPDCVIRGIGYFTGETIGIASNNCLECRCAKRTMYCTPLCCFQSTTVEENFGFNYRQLYNQNRVADPNPLAHISEELGLPPIGSI